MDTQTIYFAIGIMVACSVLPILVVSFFTVWLIVYGRKYVTPNIDEMRADFLKLRNKHPHESNAELAQRIINKQARRTGVIGALTSVGGIFVLPFGLTIDMYASTRIQNTMVQFLAWVYETPQTSTALALPDALKLQVTHAAQNMAVSSGHRLSRGLYRRVMVEVAEKSFAKLIPIVGLVLGYAVNYFTTRGMGEAVRRYYARR